ncbi:MAG: DNA gyrase subunit A [Thermotogae bacterium]|nr:DNA gyrase subunit A [Thermotogota bacterium]
MRTNYLLYSLSVIVSRAIPDVRDGLKPVQRRILYSMNELSLKHTAAFKKSARIVGEVMGKYHPHGDAAIYYALVRMAQDFSMRYMLVDGQGNFGSIDNDPPAAMRYTEARMQETAEFMLMDLEKDTVNFYDNFDGSLQQPEVLPTRLPNLLMNGVSGIAVGMATSIPSHNLRELVEGFKFLIANPDAPIAEIMKYVKGPDFPTGGSIVDSENLRTMYEEGKGKFTVRGKFEIVERKNGPALVITELPYNVIKTELIDQIVKYATRMKDSKKDAGIKDVRDESDRHGMSLVIELKKGANTDRLINDLLKHTQLQTSFSTQMNVIYKNKPMMMNLKQIMSAFIDHREEVVTRRVNFELEKAKKRAHIVEGLIKAVEGIDVVIDIIKNSDGPADAIKNLMEIIKVSEEQAKAIADLKFISLSKLESAKFTDELKDLNQKIKTCIEILENKSLLDKIIIDELEEVGKKFGDERKTELKRNMSDLKSIEELIEDEDIAVLLTQWGYVKAVSSSEYKVQGRGGKGQKGLKISDNDNVVEAIFTTRLSKLMVITSAGKAYQFPSYEIELTGKSNKGKHIANYISLAENEEIKAIVPISLDGDYDKSVMIFTRQGKVKRSSLRDFANARKTGVKAINLNEGDSVVDALVISDEDSDVLIITKKGMGLRFKVSEARVMGRGASGVNAIKLRSNDEVINTVPVSSDKELLIITEHGYGKRSNFKDFRVQSRGGIGLKTVRDTEKIGNIISAKEVKPDSDVIIFSKNGKAIRMSVSSINILGRITQGVIAVRLDKDDSVCGIIIVKEDSEDSDYSGDN